MQCLKLFKYPNFILLIIWQLTIAPRKQGSKAKGKAKGSAVDKLETTVAYTNGVAEITLTFPKGK